MAWGRRGVGLYLPHLSPVDLRCTNCSPCVKQRCTDADAKEACLLLWASVVSLLSWQQQVLLTFLPQNHTLLVWRET